MILEHNSKGKSFDIVSYTPDRVAACIDSLLVVDNVIAGYPISTDPAIKSITGSQTEDRWTLQNFIYPLPGKEDLSFIVLHKDAAVAYMIASTYANGAKSHLNRVAVLDEFQGHGIGKKLLELTEGQSRKIGATEVTVTTMFKSYEDAIVQWYERRGYNIMRTEQEVVDFLKAKNKPNDFAQFWPWDQPGKLLNLYKKLGEK